MSAQVKALIAGALYSFAAYLTTRPERLDLSSADGFGRRAGVVKGFLEKHGIGHEVDPALDWDDRLNLPSPLENFIDGITERTRELDALVNGVPTGAGLADLVADLRARQSVQLLNLADGMRVNFRAPNGPRATFNFGAYFREWEGSPIVEAMREAVAAYPVLIGACPRGEEPEQGLDSLGRLP